ncbi:MAG TPA: MBL fold metallo-hydrolase [Gemmatimonadaceae bacterium]
MRLTTVGTGTAAPSQRRVQAGHLVESGAVRLLLDCGSGLAFRFAELGIDWVSITHLAITHFHADHVIELPTLLTAWRYGTLPPRTVPLEIIGPAGTASLLDRLTEATGVKYREYGFPVTVRELATGERATLAEGFVIECRSVPHTAESVAYLIEAEGRRLVYTGDTGYDEGLAGWATGCDLLLCECSLPATLAVATHLTPEQVAALAAIARPKLLALTHLYPPVEQTDIRAVIAAHHPGPVVVAHDGWSTEL